MASFEDKTGIAGGGAGGAGAAEAFGADGIAVSQSGGGP